MSAYPLTERERQALAQADRLNAILSQSSIKEGAEAAQIRAREQAAARLQAQRNAADQGQYQAALALKYGGGPYQGTSMEAQTLNALWKQAEAQGMTREQFQAEVARQRAQRPTTVTTPDGTYTTPGLDLSFMGIGRDQSAGNFTPRVPSGDEKRGNLAVSQITSAEPGSHRPGFVEEFAQEMLPASVATLFTTNAYALSLAEQRQYLSNLIYLQSGATASPQEVEGRRLEFFPQSNDSNEVIRKKAENLEAFKRDAAAAFQSRQQRPGDKYLK